MKQRDESWMEPKQKDEVSETGEERRSDLHRCDGESENQSEFEIAILP